MSTSTCRSNGLPYYAPGQPGIAATIRRMLARADLADWRNDWRVKARAEIALWRNLSPDRTAAQQAHARDCAIMAYCRRQARCDFLPAFYAADVDQAIGE